MDTKDMLDRLWAMYRACYAKPTHVLLDPRLDMQLKGVCDPAEYPMSIDNRTGVLHLFGLPVIRVYKPYPFFAIGHIDIADTEAERRAEDERIRTLHENRIGPQTA